MANVRLGPPVDRPRRRGGCLGCLTRILLTLVVCVAALYAVEFLLQPWGFYLGGHFHPVPGWTGISRVHRPDGDYVLYFAIEPRGTTRYSRLPYFRGNGYLCTPRGDRIPLRVNGTITESSRMDTEGKFVKIDFKHRPWYWQLSPASVDSRPRLTFGGRWQGTDLVGDDGGSFAMAYQPDGTMTKSQSQYDYYHEKATNKIPMTVNEVTSWSGWMSDCRAK